MVEELVYADTSVYGLIKKKWPDAIFKDASDFIHTERFELTLPEATEDDFYLFAIREGFARCCFKFELMMLGGGEEDVEKIKRWLETLKAEDEQKLASQ